MEIRLEISSKEVSRQRPQEVESHDDECGNSGECMEIPLPTMGGHGAEENGSAAIGKESHAKDPNHPMPQLSLQPMCPDGEAVE